MAEEITIRTEPFGPDQRARIAFSAPSYDTPI